MRFIRHIAALAVLVAWLPATNHCLVGAVMPVTESGGCCGETNEHRHQHDPSENCGMCSIESGDILLSASDVFVADFHATLAWGKLSFKEPSDLFKLMGYGLGRAPPDLASWHFNIRNALPGRSPSSIL